MDYPREVADILHCLLEGLQWAISGNLVGVYLRGSLAYGGFNPSTSDLDVLVVTKHPVDETEFQQLTKLHERIAHLDNPFSKRIEVAYIDQEGVRKYQPGQWYPTIEQEKGEHLKWSEHKENWVLERWSVREQGKVLYGPEPQELIAPISPEELRQAVCRRLKDWVEWAKDERDPDWQLPLCHKAYVVETMCRALYALEKGEVVEKKQAVHWAQEQLPQRWRNLVKRSQKWRVDKNMDETVNEEVRNFIIWVASHAENAT